LDAFLPYHNKYFFKGVKTGLSGCLIVTFSQTKNGPLQFFEAAHFLFLLLTII